MSRVRPVLAAVAAVAWFAGAALADSPQPGMGTPVASGSSIVSTISGTGISTDANDDKDQYVLDGYAGQTLSVTVSQVASKTGVVLPQLDLFRPDGTTIGIADGAKLLPKPGGAPGKSAKVTFKLDQTGTWTIRVRGAYAGTIVKGDNPNTHDEEKSYFDPDYASGRTKGPYKLSVKYGTPPVAAAKNAVPNAGGVYEFAVSAAGGATFTSKLTCKGGTPTFDSLTDATGRRVPGITASYPKPGQVVVASSQPIDGSFPLGTYRVRFFRAVLASTRVTFSFTLKPAKSDKALKGTLASNEPFITSISPANGGPDVPVILRCNNAIDPDVPGEPRVFIGRTEIDRDSMGVSTAGFVTTLTFNAPPATKLLDGSYKVRVVSTSGQASSNVVEFRVVPPPEVFAMDPVVGSVSGGFQITITGARFSDLPSEMGIRYRNLSTNDFLQPGITFKPGSDANTLIFDHPNTPPLGFTPGDWAVSVVDTRSGRSAELPMRLTLSTAAAINRVTPLLVPLKGGETMYISGSSFKATDRVYLETAPGSDVYDEITATQTTFVSAAQHRFIAPDKSVQGREGSYRVYITDENDYSTSKRSFAYFRFENFTSSLGLTEPDGYDGSSTALADIDRDGDLDLVIARKGGATLGPGSQTRVFVMGANGKFSDQTATSMAPTLTDDDWRADRVWFGDVNVDGYPDLILTTSNDVYPPSGSRSHTRILLNEQRSVLLPATERAFRDHTLDLMAPIRSMSVLYSAGGTNDKDDWKGKDMWVGDLDVGDAGPPEIVITTDRVFENYYVACNPYCSQTQLGGYTYSFYWGGTRAFRWDPSARSGQGRYKYDANYFPRKSGITVGVFNPPPGITIPTCSPNSCRGTFTPFSGQRLAIGTLDLPSSGHGARVRPDIAVLNNGTVTKGGGQISSLQVALNEVGTKDGSNVIDMTPVLTALAPADYWQADTIAIGQPGYPDGNAYGVIAIAKSGTTGLSGTQSALRLIRFRPGVDDTDPGDFEQIAGNLPTAGPNDRFQSSAIAFYDVDQDGDPDLVTVARNAPGGGSSAFRVFRNEIVGVTQGMFTRVLDQDLVAPLVAPPEYFEGDALAIGDLDLDGAAEYLITRTATGSAPHTRVIRTDK